MDYEIAIALRHMPEVWYKYQDKKLLEVSTHGRKRIRRVITLRRFYEHWYANCFGISISDGDN